MEDVTRHGIITAEGNRITNIIEKPEPEKASSSLGSIGIYAFEPEIFDAIRRTEPGYKGEYQLTDSIKVLIDSGRKVNYKKIKGVHIDVGTPKDLVWANNWHFRYCGCD